MVQTYDKIQKRFNDPVIVSSNILRALKDALGRVERHNLSVIDLKEKEEREEGLEDDQATARKKERIQRAEIRWQATFADDTERRGLTLDQVLALSNLRANPLKGLKASCGIVGIDNAATGSFSLEDRSSTFSFELSGPEDVVALTKNALVEVLKSMIAPYAFIVRYSTWWMMSLSGLLAAVPFMYFYWVQSNDTLRGWSMLLLFPLWIASMITLESWVSKRLWPMTEFEIGDGTVRSGTTARFRANLFWVVVVPTFLALCYAAASTVWSLSGPSTH
jgi:hypothetical protein